jgi:hypothetical protein
LINLHATKKLQTKLPVDKSGCLPNVREQSNLGTWPTENPLGDWHGNIITLQRLNCILLVHDTTRFPLFIPCLTKPDFANLNWWFMDSLMNTLIKCGASDKQLDAVHRYLVPLQVDTECDRSVQGTMSRMAGDVEHMLWFDEVAITDVSGPRTSLWLSDRPCNVKGRKDCIWPQKEMLDLLGNVTAEATNQGTDVSAVKQVIADKELPENVISIKDYRNN